MKVLRRNFAPGLKGRMGILPRKLAPDYPVKSLYFAKNKKYYT